MTHRPVVGLALPLFLLANGISGSAYAQSPPHTIVAAPTIGGFVTGTGFDCGDGGRSDCEETYPSATTVTLLAEATAGYTFIGWTDGCLGGDLTTTVIVNQSKRCIAVFAPAPGSSAPADPAIATALIIEDVNASPATRRILLAGVHPFLFWGGGPPGFAFVYNSNFLQFISPSGPLTVRDYEEEYPVANGGGIFFIGGCPGVVSRVRIHEVTFDTTGTLVAFAADVEARCASGGEPQHFVAAVRYRATRPQLTPFDGVYPVHKLTIDPPVNGVITGPGINCGMGLSACSMTSSSAEAVTLRATPQEGQKFVGWTGACEGRFTTTIQVEWLHRCSAIFAPAIPPGGLVDPRVRWAAFLIDSAAGDPIGEGRRRIVLDAPMTLTRQNPGLAVINIRQPDGRIWAVYLAAPDGRPLLPGAYENATDAFAAHPSAPALQVRWFTPYGYVETPARGCATSPVGRFVVHEISFASATSTQITALAADFEQRCTPGGPALKGSIRFRSMRWVLEPFAPAAFTPAPPTASDFNADGLPDLVWRHAATGQNALWLMNGVRPMLTTFLLPAGAARLGDLSWEIRAVGDMNRDGRPDLIWQNSATGRIAVWFFSGAARIGTEYLYGANDSTYETDLDWKIVAAADVDGDGHTDLFWRHQVSGEMRLWHMDGVRQWDAVRVGTVSDVNWEIAALSDLDGNGLPDLVWQHRTTLMVAFWFMREALVQSTIPLAARAPGAHWRVVGTGDMNGDTKGDLVWQNVATGELGVWFMNGTTVVGGRYLEPARVDANWRIVGVK